MPNCCIQPDWDLANDVTLALPESYIRDDHHSVAVVPVDVGTAKLRGFMAALGAISATAVGISTVYIWRLRRRRPPTLMI